MLKHLQQAEVLASNADLCLCDLRSVIQDLKLHRDIAGLITLVTTAGS